MRDFYLILGVPRDASTEDIDAAFRQLTREARPDAGSGDPEAAAWFRDVVEAHEVLTDELSRASYDELLDAVSPPSDSPARPAAPPPPPPPPIGYLPPPPPSPTRGGGYLAGSPWTGGRFAAVLAAWFAGGIIGIPLAIALGFDPAEEAAGLAIVVLSQALGAFWVVLALSRKAGSGRLETDVGLRLKLGDWWWVFAGFGLQIVVAVLMAPVIDFLLDEPESRQAVTELAEETGDVGGRLLLIVIFVVVAPFIEEIIFRGVMLSWLAKMVSARWAIVISAAAFGLVHLADPGAWPAVPGLFLIGLALGWAAVRRGSLNLAIWLHAGVNLLGSIVIMWEDEITDFLDDNLEAVAFCLGIF